MLFAATLEGSTMDVPRMTLSGVVRWLEADHGACARARILAFHPDGEQYATLPGFASARLEIDAVRAVGGFARATSLDPVTWSAR